MIELGVPYECELCRLAAEWRGNPLILHVDHINGDYCDSRRENLRFLCPNCHTQTYNYAGRGKKRRLNAQGLSEPPDTAGYDGEPAGVA